MERVPVIALTWASSLSLAFVYVMVGQGLDQLLSGQPLTVTWWALIGAVLSGLTAWIASRMSGNRLADMEGDIRQGIVRHIFALGSSERTRERAGRIVNSATDGVERSATYRATFIAPMIASLATPAVVLLIVAIAIDLIAALCMVIAIPLVPASVMAFQAAFKPVSRRYRGASRKLAAQELDAIQGLSALVLMNAGKRMGHKLAEESENVRQHVMRYLAGNQLVLLFVDSIFSLGMITGAAALALWRYDAGAISAGQGLALLLLSSIMLDPLDRIGQFFYIGMGGIAATREIKRFTSQTPEVSDPDNAQIPGELPAPGTLGVEGVTFGYEENLDILTDASLQVAPGEHVVLTGASGAGKSTVSALIQAHRRPRAGRVTIDGIDIAQASLAWVHSRLAVVEQTTYLFSATLRDNLLIARPDATDDELLVALRTAHLSDLLERLPEGLDTRVGEHGMSLSGGEAQRVAIARAFLKKADILILDEPTAHVDLDSERAILEAIADIAHDRTTLTISHRQATIAHADRRVELAEGRIA